MRALAMACAACAGLCGCATGGPPTAEQVGALVFADPDLSLPAGQSCADCHASQVAFRDPETDHSTSMGAVAGRFGARNAPSAMYARFAPPLELDRARGWIGGLFWDGH